MGLQNWSSKEFDVGERPGIFFPIFAIHINLWNWVKGGANHLRHFAMNDLNLRKFEPYLICICSTAIETFMFVWARNFV